jgi:FtsZ-binding cell division protein ZapB
LVQQRKNRFLKTDSDRLLEKVLEADILSIIMNDLYKSGTSMLVEDHCAFLNKEIETLKHTYDTLKNNNDDVKNKLSNENCQLKQRFDWCQAQSLERELKLQSKNVSQSCQICKNNVSLQNQCLKLEKEIADLKIENVE